MWFRVEFTEEGQALFGGRALWSGLVELGQVRSTLWSALIDTKGVIDLEIQIRKLNKVSTYQIDLTVSQIQ